MGTLSHGQFESMTGGIHDDHRFSDVLLQVPGSQDWCDGNQRQEIPFPGKIQDSVGWNSPLEGEIPVACDYFDGVYEYIRQMLMEEDDLEQRPCMFQDCSALQAAEKYFHDALSDKDSAPVDSGNSRPCDLNVEDFLNSGTNLEFVASGSSFGREWSLVDQRIPGDGGRNNGVLDSSCLSPFHALISSSPDRSTRQEWQEKGLQKRGAGFSPHFQDSMHRDRVPVEQIDSERRKTQFRDREEGYCDGGVDARGSKQPASYEEEDYEGMDKFDKAFLCHQMNPGFYQKSSVSLYEETSEDELDSKYTKQPEVKRGRPKGSGKKQPIKPAVAVKEVVDLRTLLTRCASAVSSFDNCTAQELIAKIRQHSSPHGDANERLAHCFANALEARMVSTGSMLYTAFTSRRIPAAELLKSYQTYVTACPFKRMSNIFANKSIASHTIEADKIHIIDFGISYGFQWPCIIQGLSLRPGGPPTLRITGIDLPQPGFRPAERVEQTGRRLMSYCKRFNVPFQYNAIAKRWDEIRLEDLNIESDEMLVANCLYRLRHVPDESTGMDRTSPRDAILKLIKKLNPAILVHGVVNGAYDTPFFASRFKEALFHYSSFFDLLEATIPREDQDRLMYEREVVGREVMNAVACEGAERIERPETYKQWQVRNQRAGFEQMGLSREIMKEIKVKVRQGYHSDFLLEEDGEWMLQGWKGRVLYALSCWRPLEEGRGGSRML